MTMVIGYDAKWMLESKGGMGHYGRLALETLTQFYPKNDYMLYTPAYELGSTLVNKLLTQPCVHVKTPHRTLFSERWRTGEGILHDCHRHRAKVFHGLNGELPKGIENDNRVAAVVSVPPLVFKHFTDEYSFFERLSLNGNMKRLCKVADRLIVQSEFAKQEFLSYYDVAPEKVEVVYPCCELHFFDSLTENVVATLKQKYKLPERYILVNGEYDKRHNLETVMHAIPNIDSKVRIVFVGHRNRYWERLKALAEKEGVEHRLMRIPKVHEREMSVIYQHAEVVVCPSRYECASMTMVRAITCGTPVVAAHGSCMEEYGGNAALYFNPDSPEQLAQAVNEASGPQHQALQEAALEQAKKFSAKEMADALMRIYREVEPQNEK